jgi:prolyl-tRNA editing enzyme YbaK/EbsC (Cys-tRNA(Pro) deacylase)
MSKLRTFVTEYLDKLKIPYKVKYHSKPVYTSEDAARERNVRLSQIVKTMLLSDEELVIVAVLPAHKRLDMKRMRKLSGCRNLQLMNKMEIEQKTRLTVGAVSPVGNAFEGIPIFADPSVFDEEILDISSGDPQAGLELHREVLRRLLQKANFVSITK